MILTERQAKAELIRRGPEARRQVVEAFEEYRDIASWQARIYEQDAEREEVTLDVLWCRFWVRFWRFFEARHKAHIRWVETLEAGEQGGNR